MYRVCAADGAGRALGQPEVRDLARRHQLGDGARDLLDGHGGVDPVLVEEVDPVGAQPPQRRVGDPADVLGTAVHAVRAAAADVEAELGGDDDPVAQRLEGLADQLLVDVGAVDLGGVEERDAGLDGATQDADHLVAVAGVRPVCLAHAHAAEAEGGDPQSLAERSSVHDVLPPTTLSRYGDGRGPQAVTCGPAPADGPLRLCEGS
nr:hypothetical protein GCM10020092_066900 [Actinoplanes digitatis]